MRQLCLTVWAGKNGCVSVMKPLQGHLGPIRGQKRPGSDVKRRPSRRRVVCGIEGCECAYDGEYRLHARRRRLMHSGKKAKVANDSFGVGGRFRSWVKVPGENQHVQCEQECEYP